MRLIQAKVRCVQGVRDSGWFSPEKGASLLCGDAENVRALLWALTAFNPPYDIDLVRPLADHPSTWRQRDYERMVVPAKKTALFLIFAADPDQVRQLGEIDPDLFETDRIEVGRRLDHSRWTSFVEISQSGRWREIVADLRVLADRVGPVHGHDLGRLIERVPDKERLKGSLGEECLQSLRGIEPWLPATERSRFEHCLWVAGKFQRFREAETLVDSWLPLTLYLSGDCRIQTTWPVISNQGAKRTGASVVHDLLGLLHRTSVAQGIDLAAWADRAGEQLAATGAQLHKCGWPVPEFRVTNDELVLAPLPRSRVEQRCLLLSLTLLLSGMGRSAQPLLLLDDPARGLSEKERADIGRRLLRLSESYQMLVFGGAGMAEDDRWQQVCRIGESGVIAGKL